MTSAKHLNEKRGVVQSSEDAGGSIKSYEVEFDDGGISTRDITVDNLVVVLE